MSALSTGFINGNGAVSTVFGNSELAINYAINWRDYDKRWAYETETYKLPSETYSWIKDYNYAPFGYITHDIDIGYTFDNDKNVFSVTFQNDMFSRYQYSDIDITRLETDKDYVERDIYFKDKNYSPSLDFYYKRKLNDRSGLEFNLVGTYMTSDYIRNLTDRYVNQNDKEAYVNSDIDGNKKSLIFEGLYYKTTNKIGYSFGVRGNYSYTKNIYDETNTARLKQLELYPYGELSGRIKKLSYSIGTGFNVLFPFLGRFIIRQLISLFYFSFHIYFYIPLVSYWQVSHVDGSHYSLVTTTLFYVGHH